MWIIHFARELYPSCFTLELLAYFYALRKIIKLATIKVHDHKLLAFRFTYLTNHPRSTSEFKSSVVFNFYVRR